MKLEAIDIANLTSTVNVFWGLFAVIPTWFEYFREFNQFAISVFSMLLAIELYAVRKHIEKTNNKGL